MDVTSAPPRRAARIFRWIPVATCACLVMLWARSYFRADGFPQIMRGDGWRLDSWHGRLLITEVAMGYADDEYVRVPPPRIGAARFDELKNQSLRARLLAIQREPKAKMGMTPRLSFPPASIANGFGFGRERVGFITGSVVTLAIPYWFVCATASLPLVRRAHRWRRKRQRTSAGHCVACGYDLRGSPPGGPCPECGAPNVARVPTPAA